MFYNKKARLSYRILISLILLFCFIVPVNANNSLKKGVDVILLIDTSGSMRSSDRSRNAIEATNMFIDMLETKHSRISIIAFNDKISQIVDMIEINSTDDKESVKKIVNDINYDGFTDIGLSLKEGVEKLSKETRAENSPMVLLLTDGNIEIDPSQQVRSEQNSYDDIVLAITQAKNKIPVYTIGLNYDDNIDASLLNTIAEQTSGRNYIIDEADKLPQIFNEIFADHIQSSLLEIAEFTTDGENYNEVKIDIPSDFVSEANIILLSQNEMLNVNLYDPDGNETQFDHNIITFSKSNKYSLIKMIAPKRGEWILKARGVKNDTVRVNLFYQYDLLVEMSVEQPNHNNGDLFNSSENIQVIGKLIANGIHYEDPQLYNETSAELIIKNPEGEQIDKINAEVKDGYFFAEYMPKSEAPISMHLKVSHEHFAKDSNAVNIEFEPIIPQTSIEPIANEESETTKGVLEDTASPITKFLIIGSLILVLIIATIVIYLKRRHKETFFEGYIEIRTLDDKGRYSAIEMPSLNTYVDKLSLYQFVIENLKPVTRGKMSSLPFDLDQLVLTPSKINDSSVILLENKSTADILNESGDILDSKQLIWKNGDRIIIKDPDKKDSVKLEMTFRTEEN